MNLPSRIGRWQLKIEYKNNAIDEAWSYSESLDSITPFQVTSDFTLSGQGTGSYTPGAKIPNRIWNCEAHAPLPITTTLSGQNLTVRNSAGKLGDVFSIHLIVRWMESLKPTAHCSAPSVVGGIIVIPMAASQDELNQRWVEAVGTDFTVNPDLLTDMPAREMIAWKVKGDGQVLLSVTRIK